MIIRYWFIYLFQSYFEFINKIIIMPKNMIQRLEFIIYNYKNNFVF